MKYLPYLVTFAWDIIAIPLVLIIHMLWGENLRMQELTVCTDLKSDSWPRDPDHWLPFSGWYAIWAGTTFGHAIMYMPNPPEAVRVHERVHVRQFEAVMLKSFIVGLLVLLVTGKIWFSFALWSFGYLMYLGSNWAMAWIRGEQIYMDSMHEEHAYAVGDLWMQKQAKRLRQRMDKP